MTTPTIEAALQENLAILREISLQYNTARPASSPPEDRPQISCPKDVYDLLAETMCDLPQERLVTLLLDQRNRVQEIHIIYQGTINQSPCRPAEVLRDAVIQSASGLIIAHNHPSGDPTPSPEDISVTRDIADAGKLLDIQVLDHIVIGQGRFTSIKEHHDVF